MKKLTGTPDRDGFTVVELAIVIVVIAILAAIIIATYSGIQSRANDVAVHSDLSNFVTLIGLYEIDHGTTQVPGIQTADFLASLKWRASKGSYDTSVTNNLPYCHNRTATASTAPWATNRNGRTNWALVARSKSGAVFYVTSDQLTPTKYTGSSMNFNGSGNLCGVVISELGAPGFTGVHHGWAAGDTTTGPWREWAGAG